MLEDKVAPHKNTFSKVWEYELAERHSERLLALFRRNLD